MCLSPKPLQLGYRTLSAIYQCCPTKGGVFSTLFEVKPGYDPGNLGGPPFQCHPPKKSLALPSIEDSLTTGSFFLPGGWVEVPLDSPWYEAIRTPNHMLHCDWGWNHLCSKVRDWSCRSLLPKKKTKHPNQPTRVAVWDVPGRESSH